MSAPLRRALAAHLRRVRGVVAENLQPEDRNRFGQQVADLDHRFTSL